MLQPASGLSLGLVDALIVGVRVGRPHLTLGETVDSGLCDQFERSLACQPVQRRLDCL